MLATIYEQPFPLRYSEIGQLQTVAAAAETNYLLHGTPICKCLTPLTKNI